MDEALLIRLWPAMLTKDDLDDLRKQLDEREAERRDLDKKIEALRAQVDSRARVVAPLESSGLTSLGLRFWTKVRILDDPDLCWVYTAATGNRKNENYGTFRVSPTKTEPAHRVAYRLTHAGEPPLVVRHRCDNPPCCRPSHLLAGTQADNVADAVDRGRMRGKSDQRGEANDSAVLTDQIVLAARRRYREGESGGKLAREFSVDVNTLGQALRGTSWSHLDEIEPPVVGRRSGAKITEDDVREIRRSTERPAEIAARYGVTPSNITAIRNRKSWRHVV